MMPDAGRDLPSRAGEIEAVLFDYGGVLAEEGFRLGLFAIAEDRGLDPREFYRDVRRIAYEEGYFTGRMTESQFWDRVCRKWKLGAPDASFSEAIMSRYVLRPAMLGIVRDLRGAGYLTAILSDHSHWLDRLDARDHFFEEFDRVLVSYRLGKTKRDPSLFHQVARLLGAAPGAVLLVDNDPENVRRAELAAMRGLVFTELASFRSALEHALGRRTGT
jgi:putative hydrolase of the HAD superfamily